MDVVKLVCQIQDGNSTELKACVTEPLNMPESATYAVFHKTNWQLLQKSEMKIAESDVLSTNPPWNEHPYSLKMWTFITALI